MNDTINKTKDMNLHAGNSLFPAVDDRRDAHAGVGWRGLGLSPRGAPGAPTHQAVPSAPLPVIRLRSQPANGAPKRILIADDDTLVRGSLAAVLECEGYVVDEAHNGMEAVTRAIEHLPALVLLDLNMPHCDGWTAFHQLDHITPLLPVIVITARPNQYDNAVRLGVDAFMEKPLNIPILLRAIQRLTGEEASRHVRRITAPTFVTQLLAGTTA